MLISSTKITRISSNYFNPDENKIILSRQGIGRNPEIIYKLFVILFPFKVGNGISIISKNTLPENTLPESNPNIALSILLA